MTNTKDLLILFKIAKDDYCYKIYDMKKVYFKMELLKQDKECNVY
jgi:hypothetical protein